MKSLLIAGDRSGSGKTSITLAISALLSKEYIVQPFKVAMDYIDPSYLTGVTGRPCRNLDSFVMSPEQVKMVYDNGCIGADIAIVEGVRGLFEGSDALTDRGSTANIAKQLDLNVILVVDARSITRSAAAIVKGFMVLDPDVKIKGIILNQVGSETHRIKATTAIEHYCNIPVIGAIPRTDEMKLTMRHLGLVPYLEGQIKGEFSMRKRDDPHFHQTVPDSEASCTFLHKVETITSVIGNHIDMDALMDIAGESTAPTVIPEIFRQKIDFDIKIGVATDEAFNFYYNDLFDILGALGAEVTRFSPIHDRLPEADGYIIGGGYPELFAEELAANSSMREAVCEVSANKTPIYAECGGLIYLTDRVILREGWHGQTEDKVYPMCGVFSGETVMPAQRVIGYVQGVSDAKSPLGAGEFSGHEFHHTDVRLAKDTHYSYRLKRGKGIIDNLDGAVVNRTQASYTHLHPISVHGMIRHFTDECRKIQKN